MHALVRLPNTTWCNYICELVYLSSVIRTITHWSISCLHIFSISQILYQILVCNCQFADAGSTSVSIASNIVTSWGATRPVQRTAQPKKKGPVVQPRRFVFCLGPITKDCTLMTVLTNSIQVYYVANNCISMHTLVGM